MAMKLTLESLTVEAFSTTPDDGDATLASSAGPTLYGCTCGCNTYENCESVDPNCTMACVEPSNRTDWIACCG